LRPGHLGFVPGPASGPDGIRILHLVPNSYSAPDFKYHGSTKDIETRVEYFHERGIGYDQFHHRKNRDKLSETLGWLQDLPDYTHVLVDGAHSRADLEFLRRRFPNARHILRSHNNELEHRKDTQRATWAARPYHAEPERHAQDVIDAKMNIRVFFERDRAAAEYADVILSIQTDKSTERYWRRAGLKGEVLSQPYYLSKEYLAEIEREIGGRGEKRRNMVLCVTSSHPGALTYHSLMRFHKAVTGIGQRRPDWRFRATGRSFWMKNHPELSQRVKHLGLIDDLMGTLCEAKATAVLSDLGRGFKTKILEAILCKTWVLVTPLLFKRLPVEVQPYCIIVDPEAPLGMDEAIDRIERRQWPESDVNADLKKAAYAALDSAIYGSAVAVPISEYSQSSDDPDVTFCTVLTPVHLRLASHNYEIIKRLNPGLKMRWNVVNNRDIHLHDKRMKAFLHRIADVRGKVHPDLRTEYMQKAKEEYFDYGEIRDGLPGARVFEGMTLDEAYAYFYNQLGATPETEKAYKAYLAKCLGSYHHASGLNIALENVKTRYAIVIDPDFYVVRPGWVREIIDHMTKNDLAVFGAPWNPKWYQKFRYFPCTHLMVIDTHKLPYKRDMLAPDLVRPGGKYISLFWQGYPEVRQNGLKFTIKTILKNLKTALKEDARQRTTIAVSRDTGYTLAGEFAKGRHGLKAGLITPVYKPVDGFTPKTVFGPQRNALVDALMPDRLSYLPKRLGSHTDKGFADYSYPDYRGIGWEEFVWRGAPFSFHVRGEVHRKPIARADDVQVLNMLNATLRHMQHPPMADRTICGADLAAVNAESWDDFEKDRTAEGKAIAKDMPVEPPPAPVKKPKKSAAVTKP
jgi:hypothetical protein